MRLLVILLLLPSVAIAGRDFDREAKAALALAEALAAKKQTVEEPAPAPAEKTAPKKVGCSCGCDCDVCRCDSLGECHPSCTCAYKGATWYEMTLGGWGLYRGEKQIGYWDGKTYWPMTAGKWGEGRSKPPLPVPTRERQERRVFPPAPQPYIPQGLGYSPSLTLPWQQMAAPACRT